MVESDEITEQQFEETNGVVENEEFLSNIQGCSFKNWED